MGWPAVDRRERRVRLLEKSATMNGNTLLGLRRLIWRLRRRLVLIVSPCSVENTLSNGMHTRQVEKLEARTASTSVSNKQAGAWDRKLSRIRARALEQWSQGDRLAALSLLRSTLREHPQDSLLWMSLAQRLQEIGNVDSAYFAYTNAVEVDAGNFAALEQFVAIAESRQEFSIIDTVLSELPEAIKGKPNRFLNSIDFSIPYGIEAANDLIEQSNSGLAREVVQHLRASEQAPTHQPESHVSVAAQVRVAINRNDLREALSILRTLPESEIPADSLRRSIRRARSRSGLDPEVLRGIVAEYLRARPEETWIKRWEPEAAEHEDSALLRKGYPFPPKALSHDEEYRKDRIAYLVYNSLPYHSTGYSTRSHGLLSALQRENWDVFGVTRLGYPHDMPGWSDAVELAPYDNVDGVPYHRLSPKSEIVRKKPMKPYVDKYVDRLIEHLKRERPFIVHAASNHLNGLAAVTAARTLGMPSIYEVRGLWEITRGSRDPIWANGPEYRLIARMEAEAAKNATHVITITEALKEVLVQRGVAESKITVVPNGVDSSQFRPHARDQNLTRQLKINDRTVIGYVGSVVDYEGLGLLIEATAKLARERDDFAVLIIGDGAETEKLKRMVDLTGTEDLFRFVGRVPHDDVIKYYSLIDICPFPRLPLPVCEMVSPLKPFEAMSMEKTVLASNVAALSEIVTDNVNGLLFDKGDVGSLASRLRLLLDEPKLRRRLAQTGRSWVESARQWDSLASEVSTVYESLGAVRVPLTNSTKEELN